MSKVNEHLMTDAEKERFLKRVKIETEDISTEPQNPKAVMEAHLRTYQDNMIKQISSLEKLISTQEYLYEVEQKIFDNADALGLDKEILKTELSTKQTIIAQATSSLKLLKARVARGVEIIESTLNNYEFLAELDFYLNGIIGTPSFEDTKNDVLADK